MQAVFSPNVNRVTRPARSVQIVRAAGEKYPQKNLNRERWDVQVDDNSHKRERYQKNDENIATRFDAFVKNPIWGHGPNQNIKDSMASGTGTGGPKDMNKLALEDKSNEVAQAQQSASDNVDKSLRGQEAQLYEATKPGYIEAQDAMVFNGPAPEIINGRLAMLGFTAAMGAELFTGATIWEQFQMAPAAIAATFILFTLGSYVTIFGGTEQQEAGRFNFRNEIINGRAAMIGFSLLVAYEAWAGKPIFPHVF